MNLNWTLAKRFLSSKEHKGYRSTVILIAILGIFFATAAVIVGLGVLSGYQKVYREAVLNFRAENKL